ncbi:MAG: Ni,Fe-hydrogenase III component G [Verrucomicrobiales bacterium]|jgi:Ni,Fe-hydrogenase III component G
MSEWNERYKQLIIILQKARQDAAVQTDEVKRNNLLRNARGFEAEARAIEREIQESRGRREQRIRPHPPREVWVKKRVLQDILEIVSRHADQEEFSLIFNISASSMVEDFEVPVIFQTHKTTDITKTIVQLHNADNHTIPGLSPTDPATREGFRLTK